MPPTPTTTPDAPSSSAPAVSAQPHHVYLCFHTLASHLLASDDRAESFDFATLLARESFPHCPLFVTFNARVNPSRKPELRGCIGTFQAQELFNGLQTYALTAALRDSRFPPIGAHELERLECSVSLLHGFEDAARWDDWEVGVHGISVRFGLGGDVYSATFLPEVAEEQGWGVAETVRHLIRKAGCFIEEGGGGGGGDEEEEEEEEGDDGDVWVYRQSGERMPLRELLEGISVERYQSSKVSASYVEYLEWVKTVAQ